MEVTVSGSFPMWGFVFGIMAPRMIDVIDKGSDGLLPIQITKYDVVLHFTKARDSGNPTHQRLLSHLISRNQT